MNQGADVSSANQDGRTALHVACSMGNLHVVQFLLHHGASVHIRDHRGDSPLIDATLAKSVPVIHLLVQTGAILPWSNIRIAVNLCRYNNHGKFEVVVRVLWETCASSLLL